MPSKGDNAMEPSRKKLTQKLKAGWAKMPKWGKVCAMLIVAPIGIFMQLCLVVSVIAVIMVCCGYQPPETEDKTEGNIEQVATGIPVEAANEVDNLDDEPSETKEDESKSKSDEVIVETSKEAKVSEPAKSQPETPATSTTQPTPVPRPIQQAQPQPAQQTQSVQQSSAQPATPTTTDSHIVEGHCKDGTKVKGDPTAKGKANVCYGHKGWQDQY